MIIPIHVTSLVLTYTPPPAPYTLPLHDALPISPPGGARAWAWRHVRSVGHAGQRADRWSGVGRRLGAAVAAAVHQPLADRDRKSTRLNSSHLGISYAVLCLKKKKEKKTAASVR